MARQVARRHQRERIAGIVVVCLGLAVLAVAIVALREPNGHTAGSASEASNVAQQSQSPSNTETTHPVDPGSESSGSSSPPAGDPKSVPLIVLNNSVVAGLAKQAAEQFENGGWTVTHYDNLQNTIISTCAYFDPADPTAKAAAKALQRQFPGIVRVEPKFPQLPSGPVVVVLTGEYSPT
jgi:hypothetical protein